MPSRESDDSNSGLVAEFFLLSPLSRLGSSQQAIRRLTPAASAPVKAIELVGESPIQGIVTAL